MFWGVLKKGPNSLEKVTIFLLKLKVFFKQSWFCLFPSLFYHLKLQKHSQHFFKIVCFSVRIFVYASSNLICFKMDQILLVGVLNAVQIPLAETAMWIKIFLTSSAKTSVWSLRQAVCRLRNRTDLKVRAKTIQKLSTIVHLALIRAGKVNMIFMRLIFSEKFLRPVWHIRRYVGRLRINLFALITRKLGSK